MDKGQQAVQAGGHVPPLSLACPLLPLCPLQFLVSCSCPPGCPGLVTVPGLNGKSICRLQADNLWGWVS